MEIIIVKPTYINGQRFEPGKKPVTVGEGEGSFLIASGKARAADSPKKTVENREKDLEIKTRATE